MEGSQEEGRKKGELRGTGMEIDAGSGACRLVRERGRIQLWGGAALQTHSSSIYNN
jgi:hypothetical protein